MKNTLKNVTKIILSLVGLYLAYKNVSLQTLSMLADIRFLLLILFGVFLNLMNIFIYSIRLNIITSRTSKELFDTFKVSLKSIYFNMFLPSTIGGDSYKVTQLKNDKISYQEAITNVILDRIYGVTTIIFISIGAVAYLYFKNIPLHKITSISVVSCSLIILFVWITIFNSNKLFFLKEVHLLKRGFNFEPMLKRLDKLRKQTNKSQIFLLLLSFCTQLISSLIILIGIQYLNLQISFVEVLLYSSMSSLLLMLPISIGGLGARDYIFKEFYGYATGSPTVVFLAPIMLLISVITSVIGGLLFVADKSKDL